MDHTIEIPDPMTLDDEQLLTQAQKLIDQGDIERELQDMQAGNLEAVNRLRGLLYFLE